MSDYTITIHIHPSLKAKNNILEGTVNSTITVQEALDQIISADKNLYMQLIDEGKIRPGYLLLSDKTELRTTKKIEEVISMDMEIRIIPISHGGF